MIKRIKTFLFLTLSCVLCSIAVNWVALPNGFVVTGPTGLAMTIEFFTGIHYVVISYVITFLMLILTFFVLGIHEVSNIIFLSVLYPSVLWILGQIDVEIIFEEKLIAVALFGVIYGVGSGIAYRAGYSYGGLDTLGKILRKTIFRTTELRTVILLADSLIMIAMLSAFSLDKVAYAFVGQLIFVNCMNYVIFNLGPKLYEVQIISDNSEDIKAFVIKDMEKSLTLHSVKGAYSGTDKVQMDCVCTSKEYVKLKKFIVSQNQQCFIKVLPLTYVFGTNKDFNDIKDEDL